MDPPVDRLVIAIVLDVDTDRVLSQLAAYGFGATRIASSGGYLRASNSTVLVGLPAPRLETCFAVLRALCATAPTANARHPSPELTELYASGYAPAPAGVGVAFVASVERFERICE